MHRALERRRGSHGVLHGAPVQDRQGAGQPEADRTDVAVRRSAERGAATAENLGRGPKLGVNLKPDDRFERHEPGASAPTQTFGPARRTSSSAWASNALKFSANIAANRFACTS